jgi:hypothetical protein
LEAREPGENDLQPPVGQHERVAARHDHVPDLAVGLEVLEGGLELGHRDLFRIAHLAAPSAETAIAGADRRDQEERPIRIAMGDVGDGTVAILGERVHDPIDHLELLQCGCTGARSDHPETG